jgi:predicted transcriptional regulator
MKGLLIKSPHIEKIIDGKKTWELRGSQSKNLNATVGLIRSASGLVVGKCKLTKVHGPLTRADLEKNASKHCLDSKGIDEFLGRYKKCYAWELADVSKLKTTVPYKHPYGAVIWVNLEDSVAKQVEQQ